METDPTGWLPTDVERQAEQLVLGSMMIRVDLNGDGANSPAIDTVTAALRPGHLFREPHRWLMEAILELDMRGDAVDPVTVASELEARGQLGKVGGAPYLHSLMSQAWSIGSVGRYVEIVKDASTRRASLDFAKRVGQLSRPGVDANDLIDAVERTYRAYVEEVEGNANGELRSAGDAEELHDILDSWGEAPEGAMTTGITDLDAVLNVPTGSMVVVAGKSGVGKSILSSTIGRHYALPTGRHEPVIVFSMEMSRKQLQQRDLAAIARIRADSATGKTELDEFSRRKLYQAAAIYAEAEEYFIVDNPKISIPYIHATMREVHRRCGRLGLAIVDYAGLVDLPKTDREDQALGELSRALKTFAREFDCIVILVSQLNRKMDDRVDGVPRAGDIRGSGRLEHDADAILLVHDPKPYDDARAGEIDLLLAKQRDGIHGRTITVADQRHRAQFGDLAVKEEQA
jgi:replicative DNA helicase